MTLAWHSLPVRATSGIALIILIILTAPGWLCYAFLPERRQERMLALMKIIVTWVRSSS